MGLANQLFRRECHQFCGGEGADHFYAVTGAGAKAGGSRAGLASRCLAGFLERNGVEVLAHCHQAVASGCFLFRWQLRSGATWSEGKASKSAVLAHGHQASVSETLAGLLRS